MSHIAYSEIGLTPFERLIGHSPEILDYWLKLEVAFFQSPTFGSNFLEQIRRVLAFDNLCQYCMAKAGRPDQNPDDARLAAALRFANKFAIDHKSINESEILLLKRHFSAKEISEFIAFCSFVSASQRFGAVLDLQAAETYI